MWVPTFAFKHLNEQPNEITKAEAPEEYQGVSSCKELGNVGLQAPHGARRGFSSPWGLTRTVGEVDSLTPDFSPLQGESSTSRGRRISRGKRKVVAGMEGNAKCILPGKTHIMHNICEPYSHVWHPSNSPVLGLCPRLIHYVSNKKEEQVHLTCKNKIWILLNYRKFWPPMYHTIFSLNVFSEITTRDIQAPCSNQGFFNRHFPVSVVIWTVFCKNSTENFQKRLVLPDWFNPCFLYLYF